MQTVTVTSGSTWTAEIDVPPSVMVSVMVGVAGTTSGGTRIRLRWRHPALPTRYYYSDPVETTGGGTFITLWLVGPALVSAGCRTGEYGNGDNAVVLLEATARGLQ